MFSVHTLFVQFSNKKIVLMRSISDYATKEEEEEEEEEEEGEEEEEEEKERMEEKDSKNEVISL